MGNTRKGKEIALTALGIFAFICFFIVILTVINREAANASDDGQQAGEAETIEEVPDNGNLYFLIFVAGLFLTLVFGIGAECPPAFVFGIVIIVFGLFCGMGYDTGNVTEVDETYLKYHITKDWESNSGLGYAVDDLGIVKDYFTEDEAWHLADRFCRTNNVFYELCDEKNGTRTTEFFNEVYFYTTYDYEHDRRIILELPTDAAISLRCTCNGYETGMKLHGDEMEAMEIKSTKKEYLAVYLANYYELIKHPWDSGEAETEENDSYDDAIEVVG